MAFEILKPALKRQIKGVLTDMDGVVLDSEILYSRFWMEALNTLGYPMSYAQALGMRSLNRDRGQQYLSSLFGPGVDYSSCRELRIRLMDSYIRQHGVAAKPGIYSLMDYLKEKALPCAIASSSPPERIKEQLSPAGLYSRFSAICSAYQLKRGKPEPDIYIMAAGSLSLSPQCCLALEDSPAGIESAFRSGALPVIIPDLDEPGEELLSMCFARADSLEDIAPMLEELNSGS